MVSKLLCEYSGIRRGENKVVCKVARTKKEIESNQLNLFE